MFNSSVRISSLLAAALLVGCSATVGNRADFEQVEFAIGETSKQDVAQALGLPAEVKNESGMLLWGYTASPRLSGFIIPVPVDATSVNMQHVTIDEVAGEEFENAAMVYGFDESGVLRQVLDQRKGEE
ncbi:hypothetical protein NLU14_10755 [Marinobacter sp. 71-i]|uniref:Lipoprotein SmpA/OmlA domain-containing protein n=1 Tax=Marinobacter iranensis TaxID=2962607 RepID=A0ABT5YAJ6_9GAMM|nr:hypothetical protein [Marinobacter iranensis]MDF0750708.1 hypothetical protein [Marinobacter iranensis]